MDSDGVWNPPSEPVNSQLQLGPPAFQKSVREWVLAKESADRAREEYLAARAETDMFLKARGIQLPSLTPLQTGKTQEDPIDEVAQRRAVRSPPPWSERSDLGRQPQTEAERDRSAREQTTRRTLQLAEKTSTAASTTPTAFSTQRVPHTAQRREQDSDSPTGTPIDLVQPGASHTTAAMQRMARYAAGRLSIPAADFGDSATDCYISGYAAASHDSKSASTTAANKCAS